MNTRLSFSRGGSLMFFFEPTLSNFGLSFFASSSITISFLEPHFYSLVGVGLLSSSSNWIIFSERILLMLLILKEFYSLSFLVVLSKVTTLFYYSKRDFGNLTARNRSTLGHLIGSINLISPSSALNELRLISIPLRMAVSSIYCALGRMSSSTTRHILTKFLN